MMDPKNLAERIKEIGPEKAAELICGALGALCKKGTDNETAPPKPPQNMRDAADSVGNAMSAPPQHKTTGPWA